MNCLELQNLLQSSFDGESPLDRALIDQHLEGCQQCRELHEAALLLETGLRVLDKPAPPADLTDRLVRSVLSQHRKKLRWQRGLMIGSLAAAVAIAVSATLWFRPGQSSRPGDEVVQNRKDPDPLEAAVMSLNQSAEEAGSALAALTRRTAEETMKSTQMLLPDMPAASAQGDEDMWQQALDPAAKSLKEAGQGVSTTLEPVTNSARRAVSLFWRDLSAAGPEVKY